jgi:hypothetical protein
MAASNVEVHAMLLPNRFSYIKHSQSTAFHKTKNANICAAICEEVKSASPAVKKHAGGCGS